MLNKQEYKYIFDCGYTIRHRWIGSVEGWQYEVYKIGLLKPLAFRKSERAAYNFIKKNIMCKVTRKHHEQVGGDNDNRIID